jgi:hypothetical protein
MSFKNILIALVIIAAIAFAALWVHEQKTTAPLPPSLANESPATSSAPAPDMNDSLSARIPFPSATSTGATSSWKSYSNPELGYSLKYPADLMRTVDGATLALSFPKNGYFTWPLLDDVTVRVTASSSCPTIENEGLRGDESPASFSLNGREWKRSVGLGAAAGNRYEEVLYATTASGTCYSLYLLDHSAASAGLYVDDASLIARYDAVHADQQARILAIFNDMVASVRIAAR